jgi:hypothetical protein
MVLDVTILFQVSDRVPYPIIKINVSGFQVSKLTDPTYPYPQHSSEVFVIKRYHSLNDIMKVGISISRVICSVVNRYCIYSKMLV